MVLLSLEEVEKGSTQVLVPEKIGVVIDLNLKSDGG